MKVSDHQFFEFSKEEINTLRISLLSYSIYLAESGKFDIREDVESLYKQFRSISDL